jgi:hypothetical protein
MKKEISIEVSYPQNRMRFFAESKLRLAFGKLSTMFPGLTDVIIS